MSMQRKFNKGLKPPWWTEEAQKHNALKGPNPNLPAGHVQIRPMEFNGSERIEAREGGMHPLWVVEMSPGVFTSAWSTHNKDVVEAMKANKGKMAMTIVIDTNVPGHPSISVCMQPVHLTKG